MNLTSLSQIHDSTINEHSSGSHVNYTRVDRQMEQGKFNENMEAFWERFLQVNLIQFLITLKNRLIIKN